MSDWPPVSVIVPVLNEAPRVDACLKALLAQTYPSSAMEIIVVDNGSTDDTPARVARYPVTLAHALVRGPARARNAGIRLAKGEFLAFLDGDCIPAPNWLAALLEGREDPAIGFFAGRIEGVPPAGFISQYVSHRQIISQAGLLSQPIPTAATGNLAVSRTALSRVGGFDESLRWGEDADLTWRILVAGGLDFRYNPEAVVAHRHPDGPVQLACRSFHEGFGVAAFRLKHAGNFHPKFLSRARYRWILGRTAAGLLRYPWAVRAGLAKGLPWPEAAAYPVLDKVRSLGLLAGISRGLPGQSPGAEVPGSGRLRTGATGRPSQPWIDPVMDLEAEPLLRNGPAGLTARIRQDLREIGRTVQREIPQAVILLTGSMSVNEGRWAMVAGEAVCRSDFDLVVIAPDWRLLRPQTLWRRLGPRLQALQPITSLDVGLVWTALVRRGWTTTGGRIIAGDPALAVYLEALTAPRAAGALWRSFKHLAQALLEPAAGSFWLGKALLEAAQARLLHECRGRPRREWAELSSMDRIRDRLRPFAAELGEETLALIDRAADLLSGRPAEPFREMDARPALRILRQVRQALPPPRGMRHTLVEASRQFHRGRFHTALRPSLPSMMDELDALSTAWLAGDPYPPGDRPGVKVRNSAAESLPAADSVRVNRYRQAFLALQEQGDFLPHKFFLPAADSGRGTAVTP